MITKMESFKNNLRAKKIKPTFIRLKILDYLERNRVHPTAEAIYRALEKEIPTLSRTSVYNTLNVFYEKKLVTPLFITGLEARFERNLSPHHHFLCEKCNQIIDLDIECSYFKKGGVKGHEITELHGYFKGICRDCLKKEKKISMG
jgi:Fur family peroxide stress response transcriptional regulator